ncbi:MAG: amidase [Planctomycetota bacterium]
MTTQDDLPDVETVAAAERLAGIDFTPKEREQMRRALADALGRAAERRALPVTNGLAPAETFDPWLGAAPPAGAFGHRFDPASEPGGVPDAPSDDADLAFAPVVHLASWLADRSVTSRRLVEVSLARIERLDPQLEACITVDAEGARAAADRADAELAAGRNRGPLHGVPYGLKDLFDTKGLRTTFGAEPYRERVPDGDAAVVERLREAGAVLVAKTALGALAYGDVWFGGRTNNPWNVRQGSSGSSAGSCAGVAAGLFPFAIGTETYGSIVSPSARCGTVGLRPTFGRVSRAGAMALCWSLDKVGAIARRVDDTALVLAAIAGEDRRDGGSRAIGGAPAAGLDVSELRVGANAAWFRTGSPELRALDALRELGCEVVEVALPEGPWGSLVTLLHVEAAAAFEDLTRSGDDDRLVWQDDEAWPNTFRSAWFVPAIEFVKAQRLRRTLCEGMARAFLGVDLVLAPNDAADLLWTTNLTGQPSLTLRCGVDGGRPRTVTLWGKLAGEGALVAAGRALEERLGVWQVRPELG